MDVHKPIVVLTGAGISQESGIATFRDKQGLWENHSLEDVATVEAFEKNPKKVHAFYNERRAQILSGKIEANAAHLALAKLEARFPGGVHIVTQNVDNLHEKAGSFNVTHMHGSLLEAKCIETDRAFPCTQNLSPQDACPCCGKKGNVRPNNVWFGEIPYELDKIFTSIEQCGLFISIGTSGQVYPAAGFIQHVKLKTASPAVELNLEPSPLSYMFNEKIYGKASEIVPAFVERLLKDHKLQ